MRNNLQKKLVSCLLIMAMMIGYAVPSFNAIYALTSNELPDGFTSVAIGNNDGTGSATFDKTSKVLSVKGSGQYVGKGLEKTDSYQFVNYKVEGDATIIARLLDFDTSQAPKGQAGVFIREDNNTDNANYYGVYVDPTKDAFRCGYRDNVTVKSGATSIAGLTASSKNQYIKIVKKGSKFTYSISSDKTFPEDNTITTKTKTVTSTSNTWYAGFVVSNGGSDNSAVANFDNITIEDSTGVVFTSSDQIVEEMPELPETPALPEYNQGVLPNGFTNSSIGNNSENILASFDKTKKQFIVNGSGTYIGKDTGATDNYQFVNYKVEGNATIVARLVDFDMSGANYGQAGVFVREDNTTNNADYFGVYVEPSKDQYRYAFRDKAASRTGAAAIAGLTKDSKNQFIKIVKTGNQFKYYISEDSTFPADKTLSNSQTVLSDNNTWYVGFVVSNGGSETPAVATFDNVRIENESKVYYDSEIEAKPVDTVENVKAEGSDSKVTLTWNAVENATSYIVKRATSKNGEYTTLAEVNAPETTYVDNNVENFDTYYYKITAKNENGLANDSQVAVATPNNSNSSNIQYEENAAVFNMTKEPNDTVSNSVISLAGSTNKDGYISIIQNGEVKVKGLEKKANELFEQTLTLDSGRNTIEIYQTTEDGKNTIKSYNIVYLEATNYNKIVDSNYTGVDGEMVDGISRYKTIASAINSVSKDNKDRVNIYVKNGTYKEKLIIEKPYVSLIGEDSKKTILTYDAANGTINPATGKTYGTSGSASVTIKSKSVGFTAENLTIENAFKETGANNEQAVALNNQADQSIFVNCRFIGNQDTLLADASSSSPARQYYYKCYIEGDVDFIFGRAQAVFNDCDIASFNRKSTSNNGYITAADTWDSDAYGYLIMNSRLIGLDNIAANTVSLGRPWRPSSQTRKMTPAVTYVNCYMGDHITSKGWEDMGVDSPASTARFYEYGSYGPGAKFSDTRNILNNNQAMNYTMSRVFAKNSATKEDGSDGYTFDWMPTDESSNVNINSWYENIDKVEKLELNVSELPINVGDSFKLTATVSTTNNQLTPAVIFESSDNSVATVDENGNVTALKVGSAIITAKSGNKQATCTVTVTYKQVEMNVVPVISAEDVVIRVGDDFDPMLKVSANDHEDGDLTDKVEIIENTVDTTNAGEYKVVYKVTDSKGAIATKEIKVTVNPKFTIINRVPVINAEDVVIRVGDDFDPMLKVSAEDKEDGNITSSIEIIENTVDTAAAGIYKVVYKVTDSKGAIATKEIKVTVNPKFTIINRVPVINAEDVVIRVGDDFDPMLKVSAEDKEDGNITSSIEIIENTVDTAAAGIYKVVYKVTDSKGASATKEIKVTVNPKFTIINRVPVINAEDVVINTGDDFNPMLNVTANDHEDGDLTDKVEIIENTVDTTNAGEYKVVYKVTDSKGAIATKEIKVTVNPKFTIINRVPVINAEDVVIRVGDDFDPMLKVSAEDKEDGNITSSIEIIENTVDTAAAGIYKVVYKVTDSKGAIATKEIKVTVNPKFTIINRVPVISAEDVVINTGDDFNPMLNVTANDHEDGDLTDKVEIIENTVDTTNAGEYKVVYKVTDSKGASATKEIKVTVNPKFTIINRVPVINAEDVVIRVGDDFDPMLNVTANDHEDGDLTDKVEIIENTVDTTNAGEYKVVYKVTDSKGASATKEIKVTVNPKFTIINRVPVINAEDVVIRVGDDFDPMLKVSANDHEDGDLTDKVEIIENTVDTTNAGEYKVVYKVTDSKGAIATKEIKVTVNPKFTIINRVPVINAEDVVIRVGDDFDPMLKVSAEDKEDGNITSSIEIIENTVDTAAAGIYKVVYKVTDSKGASATKEIKVTVNPKFTIINRVPVINAEDVVINTGDDFNPMLNVTANDHEDGDLTDKVEIIENTVDTTNAGEYKVVYKVTDSKGASATKEIKVTVEQVVIDEPVEDPEEDTNKPGEDTDDSEEDTNKPGEDEEDSEEDTNKPGEDVDDSEEDTNKPGEDVDDSEEDPTKPGEDEEDSEDDTTKPGEDTDNSENVNKPEVDNNDNSSDLLSPETGDAGIFAMVSLIVVAGSVIYAINRKKSK